MLGNGIQKRKKKVRAYDMKRVAAGAHLPTLWLFVPAKRSDDRTDYCLAIQMGAANSVSATKFSQDDTECFEKNARVSFWFRNSQYIDPILEKSIIQKGEMESCVQVVVGSIVWGFRRLKNPSCREISARGYALHSVCPNFRFFPLLTAFPSHTIRI